MSENSTTADEQTDEQPSVTELAKRIEDLEETQKELKQGAIDAQGRNWQVSDFLNLGLSRRQALSAIALIAGGLPASVAVLKAVSPAAADPGDNGNTTLGTSSNRWDAWMGEVDANTVTATDAAVANAPSSATDVTRKEDLDTHASQHHDDGVDELDAGDLSGAAGADGEVLVTDGDAASWASQSGGTTFATESGSFSAGAVSTTTTDVTLSNTYSADAFIPTVGMVPNGSSEGADGCQVSSITTDANGDVTGFVVETRTEGGWDADHIWYIMGAVV